MAEDGFLRIFRILWRPVFEMEFQAQSQLPTHHLLFMMQGLFCTHIIFPARFTENVRGGCTCVILLEDRDRDWDWDLGAKRACLSREFPGPSRPRAMKLFFLGRRV